MTIPTVSTSALGYGAFLGLYANCRYQLLCGFERAISNHFDVIAVPLLFGMALRSVTFTVMIFVGNWLHFQFCQYRFFPKLYSDVLEVVASFLLLFRLLLPVQPCLLHSVLLSYFLIIFRLFLHKVGKVLGLFCGQTVKIKKFCDLVDVFA